MSYKSQNLETNETLMLASHNNISQDLLESKESQIDSLEKKIRQIEHDKRFREIQYESEINSLKARIHELEVQINEALSKNSHGIILELEKSLSISEEEILNLRKQEISLKTELSQVKNDLLALQLENSQLNQIKDSIKRKSCLLNKNSIMSLNSNGIPIEKYNELQRELEEKENMFSQLKSSSLETIMEKEKIIYDLQARLQDADSLELRKIIEALENKVTILDEELISTQRLLSEEKEKNRKKNSVEINRNIQEIIHLKSKEMEKLLEMAEEQEDKANEMNRKFNELEVKCLKYENLIKSLQYKNDLAFKEKSQFMEKSMDLEGKIPLKEKEISSLKCKMTEITSNHEKDKNELLDKLEKKEILNKKNEHVINELKNQNRLLKEKNFELHESLETYIKKCDFYLKEIDIIKEKNKEIEIKSADIFAKKNMNLRYKASKKEQKKIDHKRTLSQELGPCSTNAFSFLENLNDETTKPDLKTRIRFSKSLDNDENLLEIIKKEKENLMSQLNDFQDITIQKKDEEHEEHLSTVEDQLSENSESPMRIKTSSKNSELLREQIEVLKEDLNFFENENKLLKKDNESLKKQLADLNNNMENELNEYHKRESQYLDNLQKQRKENISNLHFGTSGEEDKKQYTEKILELEIIIKDKENEIYKLKFEITQLSSTYEREKKEILKNLEEKDIFIKEQYEIINELKIQNKKMEEKISMKNIEFHLPKSEKNLKELISSKKELLLSEENPLNSNPTSKKDINKFVENEEKIQEIEKNIGEIQNEELNLSFEKQDCLNNNNEKELSKSDSEENSNESKHSAELKIQISELNQDLSDLESNNLILKNENERLKGEIRNLNERMAIELKESHMRESQVLNNLQRHRKESILNFQSGVKDTIIQSLEAKISSLEARIKTLQDEFNEEKEFLQQELKEMESKAIDAKMKYAIILTERDELVLKCKELHLKLERSAIKTMPKNKSFFNFLFCNDS